MMATSLEISHGIQIVVAAAGDPSQEPHLMPIGIKQSIVGLQGLG